MRETWTRRLLPLIGPILLYLLWETAVSAKWLNPVLLPSPGETVGYLFKALSDGSMNQDIGATFYRTLMAFIVAAIIGVPLGVVLGSSERLYRSVEFLVDFFRSTPSSALIPLFMRVFLALPTPIRLRLPLLPRFWLFYSIVPMA